MKNCGKNFGEIIMNSRDFRNIRKAKKILKEEKYTNIHGKEVEEPKLVDQMKDDIMFIIDGIERLYGNIEDIRNIVLENDEILDLPSAKVIKEAVQGILSIEALLDE